MNPRTTSPANAFVPTGRLLLAALFVVSAITKLAAPSAIQGYIASVGLPFPVILFWGTVLFEVFAGLALAAGYQTRWVALALAAFTVVTAAVFHNALGNPNELAHFLKNLAVAGGLLQLAAASASQRDPAATLPATI
jgi:putative oxidoreductase